MQALTAAELTLLAQLRARFLDGSNSGGGYWRTEAELALYDATFAQRIGWKWDAVLGELLLRGWKPQSPHLCDFGCGSGIASRRVLGAWEHFASLTVADVSPRAVQFAETKARVEFPAVAITGTSAESLSALVPGTLLLVSHVINELSPTARDHLLSLARQAGEVIWVEAGTHADSRALIAVREELRGDFAVIAPCTHGASCGMLPAENAPHWCHHFGRVPSHVFQDAGWAQLGRELGIDLRSLPYSFLVLSRSPSREAPGAARIIGHPREAKGRMEILACDSTGVAEVTLQKRDVPKLFKALQKGKAEAIQRWRVVEGKVLPEVGES